ncbi:MAG: helix-turn-helix domain-containing protein [Anaerolineae bacterium]|nr:helix-turn-helix domain-containing protein [Anaerolineae bacterium]
MSTFGILLKNYRTRAALSQSDLSVAAGLSASTISRMESGTRSPLHRRSQVLALARALGLDQGETDALLSAADLAPSTAPELSLHPRDETLYRIAQELESLRSDPQIALAQVRFVEETLLLVLRGARAALPAADLAVLSSGAPAGRALSEEERYLDDLLGDAIADPRTCRAVPFTVLAAVARSPRWELKRRLAEALPALVAISVPHTVALMRTLRADPPDPEWRTDIRRRVIEALPALWSHDKDAVAELLRWEEGDEVYAGLATLDALVEIGDPALAQEVRADLLSHAAEQDGRALRVYAEILDLCQSDPPRALQAIERHRADPARLVRICAARALHVLIPDRPAEALKAMRRFLAREMGRPVEHQNVRRALARHAGALVALLAGPYDEPALALLRTLASDEDVHVRRAISDVLPDVIALSPEVALDLIDAYLLQDRDHFIHERTWAALRSLMSAGSDRAEELCAELIEIA